MLKYSSWVFSRTFGWNQLQAVSHAATVCLEALQLAAKLCPHAGPAKDKLSEHIQARRSWKYHCEKPELTQKYACICKIHSYKSLI